MASSADENRGRTAHPADVRELLGSWFDGSPLAALLIDECHIVVAANRRARALLESDAGPVVGRSALEFRAGAALFDPDRPETMAFHAGAIDHLEQRTEMLTKSGDVLLTDLFVDALLTRSGRRYVLAQLQDVTEVRRIQRALAASELRFAQLANSLPDASVLMFDHDLRTLVATGESLTPNGYQAGAIVGRLLADVVPAKAFDLLAGPYRDALSGRSADFEYLSPVNGRRYRIRVRPVADQDGAVVGGLALSEDISDDHARKAQLEQIHRLSRLGSCWYDRRLGWVFDDELLTLWGLESSVCVSPFPIDLVVAEDRVAISAARDRILNRGGRSSLPYQIHQGKSGAIRHLQCTFESVVDDDGALMSATATHVDVTDTVVALETMELIKAEAAEDQRAMLLRRVSDALAAAYSGPDGPLHSIADLAAADMMAAAVLRVLTPDLQSVEFDVTSHPDEAVQSTIATAMTLSGQCFEPGPIRDQVIRQGRIVSSVGPTTRLANHDRFIEQTGWQFEHSITAPLRHNGLVLGLFCVLRSDANAPFEVGDEHLVQVLADRAGAAIGEYRIREVVEREATERLRELTEQQRELLEELAGMELHERNHIAESIHDEPIQLIVAAAMRIDTLRMGRTGTDEEELNRLAELLESSVDWLRKLIQVDLSPPDLTYGIGGALRNLADGIFAGVRPLRIDGPTHVNLSAPATAAAYRILREALLNSHKHAHAQNIGLRIEELDSMVVLSVSDDGVGTADTAGPGHLGLATMRARAEAEGGKLHIHSSPGAGMTTVLTLPITPGARA